MQSDLFSYPHEPGWKARETSRAAAERVDAGTLRAKVLLCIHYSGPMTADECAAKMGQSILSVRPRCTELSRLGRLVDSGKRRPNSSGRKAIVWRAKCS